MNVLKKAAVLLPVEERHKRLLEQAAPETEFDYCDGEGNNLERLSQADGILGNPSVEVLPQLKGLKWLQLASAGANLYTVPGVLPPGVLLTNATGAYGLAISEYMVGGVLELFKNLHLYRDQQAKGIWQYAGGVKSIWGSTVLVVGLGDIGGEFAKRMKALGAKVIGIKRRPGPKAEYLDELCSMEQLDSLLGEADVVALSLPETPQTVGLMDTRRLALMKEDAVLVNVGRGSAVDTLALCRCLEEKKLRGAVLDVTAPEPLPEDHPIWKIPSAVITPHVSGGYTLPETFERVVSICADNLKRYREGLPLRNLIDFETGYKI